jgi:hypothetical protein
MHAILVCSDAHVQLLIFTDCFVAGLLLANGKSKLALLLKAQHTIFPRLLLDFETFGQNI